MALRVVVAPSGFKECLSAEEVSLAISEGVRRAAPGTEVREAPLVDGGEGFTRTLVRVTGGTIHEVEVTGPVGEPVRSHFGFLGQAGARTGVIEMAAAAGLRLVPASQRDPLRTTTYGVGELIRHALDEGAERILLGCGDSGTNDGGMGMAQALGVRFLDAAGAELGRGGQELARLERIDTSGRDRRLNRAPIEVACNWHNILCGPSGVSRVFGPQKGASAADVERLARSLDHYAAVIRRDIGVDVSMIAGGGASGGLGAGLYAFAGATLHPRYDVVMQYLDLDGLLEDADLVFTAEGSLDGQTPRGKIPAEVARRAKRYGVPVIALAGTLGPGVQLNIPHGIDAFASILARPCTLEEAMAAAPALIRHAAENLMRSVLIGGLVETRRSRPAGAPRTAGAAA